ncbi:hypothetical protein EON83_03265 [bacterium]|nr:MAG: hypothetical protein EON83_03265 [bacterium]
MTLPVLILGGAVFWRSLRSDISSRFGLFDESKPLHVTYSAFEPVELSPYDVSRGYSWSVKSDVKMVGIANVPPNWKETAQGLGERMNTWLVYRRGKTWRIARPPKKDSFCVEIATTSDDGSEIRVDLRTVPRDAEEVRLRGRFRREQWFTGPLPTGWKPPANMMISGPHRILTVESKPFDIPIKEPGQPFPSSHVSRTTPFQLVDAKWIIDSEQNHFLLQLRRTDGQKWNFDAQTLINVSDVRIQDEDGNLQGIGESSPTWVSQTFFSPQKLESDLIIKFVVPEGNYKSPDYIYAKGPLKLRAKVSDWKCWPLDISVSVPRTVMKLRDFGAPTPNR